MGTTYKDAGVDLDIYAESMRRLPALMRRTADPRVLPLEGGFAGLFQLDFAEKLFARDYRQPVLVAGTDGVGTKVLIARQMRRYDTIGIDLVAMCVNDVLCTGAEPLLFLDYVAMGKDDPSRLEEIVRGVSDGCLIADCALLGGETAIMPDVYAAEEIELAGFAVGVVEKKRIINGKSVDVGDTILGIPSNGVHSNGYSLVRKILDNHRIDLASQPMGFSRTVGETLLAPTEIYVRSVRQVLNHYRVKNVVHAIAHITGGGLHDNLSRVLPRHVDAVIESGSWPMPPVFPWLQHLGDVSNDEMTRVFNMGIGLVLVVSQYYAQSVIELVQGTGQDCHRIGTIVGGTGASRQSNRS
jgi:phosphoribosylformylglycinamidine cyclo-ligase